MARKALKVYGKQWSDSLFRKALNIKYNGIQITSSLLIDLWFNAHYFHSDEAKIEELENIKGGFSEQFAKCMLIDAVMEASKIVYKVYVGISQLINERRNS